MGKLCCGLGPARAVAWAVAAACCVPGMAVAHGILGNRFFPPTITTDDPFAADELALPTLSFFRYPGGGGNPTTRVIDSGFEFDKLIIPRLSIGFADDYLAQKPEGSTTSTGWDNITLIGKYELYTSDRHEAIISVGLNTTLGGTGSPNVGNPSYTTFTPTLYFGKGFGDLPDALAPLQPIAITGTFGQSFQTSAAEPNLFQTGIALEYSLPYLQQHVEDIGLPAPFKNMIPLVEFALQTPENRGGGPTTGTINPGVLWETPDVQFGVEALIPINNHSGHNVGAIFQMQIYIDDLMPKIFGHPIFGGN